MLRPRVLGFDLEVVDVEAECDFGTRSDEVGRKTNPIFVTKLGEPAG